MILHKKKDTRDDRDIRDDKFTRIPTQCGCEIWTYLMHLDDEYRPEVTKGRLCQYHQTKTKEDYLAEKRRKVYSDPDPNWRLTR